MRKAINFYTYESNTTQCIHGYTETEAAIKSGVDVINTTQMSLLSFDVLDDGYDIWIYEPGREYQIKLGDNDVTYKFLRKAHNIFKLWRAGSFRDSGDDVGRK